MSGPDFLSRSKLPQGRRVLPESRLARRASDQATAGHRPAVLQRGRLPTQLSLFGSLEPPTRTVEESPDDSGSPASDLPERPNNLSDRARGESGD